MLGFIHLRMDTAAQSETLVSLVRAHSASCTSLTTGKGIRVFGRPLAMARSVKGLYRSAFRSAVRNGEHRFAVPGCRGERLGPSKAGVGRRGPAGPGSINGYVRRALPMGRACGGVSGRAVTADTLEQRQRAALAVAPALARGFQTQKTAPPPRVDRRAAAGAPLARQGRELHVLRSLLRPGWT